MIGVSNKDATKENAEVWGWLGNRPLFVVPEKQSLCRPSVGSSVTLCFCWRHMRSTEHWFMVINTTNA